jgi:hypothetical protein
MIKNPYIEEIKRIFGLATVGEELQLEFLSPKLLSEAYNIRKNMLKRYAWAIPSNKAIATMAKYGPYVEMGAGTGYWAWCLDQAGVKVIPYDIGACNGRGHNWAKGGYSGLSKSTVPTWIHVFEGSKDKVLEHPDHTLFLCWPPLGASLAADCLKLYQGKYLAYVGEGQYGCTGDDDFHELLEAGWDRIEFVCLPQWNGIHDCLVIYQRKS